MSIEYVFERFCQLLSEKVEREEIEKEWHENSFCFHVLTSGARKGNMCEKKCVPRTFYCKTHASDVVKIEERNIEYEEDEEKKMIL
jgi:hypothetical protein